MPARIPLQLKSPFVIDSRPLKEMSSPHAGLLATSRALRSLQLPLLIAAHLPRKKRQRGFSEAQMIESILLLQTAGGNCPEHIQTLAGDPCLERGLGYALPKTTALRTFLERFHDPSWEALRPARSQQKSFILPGSQPVQGLQRVQAGVVQRIARLYAQQQQALCIATIDQDATIIEGHKRAARSHYQGGRGYQPMVAMWAEADLVVADEFRDGDAPAHQGPLSCAQMAFEALPGTIQQRYFRGDSASHEPHLIDWLRHPQRARELVSAKPDGSGTTG